MWMRSALRIYNNTLTNKKGYPINSGIPFIKNGRPVCYLLTWNFLLPVLKKSAIWRAAAKPALILASSV